MTKLDDAMQVLVDDMIAGFDEVTGQWKPCWSMVGWLPSNALTGAAYKGTNVLFLWAAALKRGYPTPTWATYKQWATLGGQIRKGETGVHCVKWSSVVDKKDPDKTRMIPNTFVVFNIAQQDGYEISEISEAPPLEQLEVDAFIALASAPAKYSVGDPCYIPALDVICLPPKFDSPEQGIGTWAHELAHWTGHKDRLARDMTGRFGDDAYAFEELVAEISAAFTCAQLGIQAPAMRDDHVRYLKSWFTRLKAEPSLLMTAAQLAQRATYHLMEYSTCNSTSSNDPVLSACGPGASNSTAIS